jgi:hypothetical protein
VDEVDKNNNPANSTGLLIGGLPQGWLIGFNLSVSGATMAVGKLAKKVEKSTGLRDRLT